MASAFFVSKLSDKMLLEGIEVFPGLMKATVIFSDEGWLAMHRNSFMMAFFSEN